MSTERHSMVVTSVVYLGAAILIGIPAMQLLALVISEILAAIGLPGVAEPPVGDLVVLAVALLLGLQLAVEAAAVQLSGIEALGRGSPRAALLRFSLLSASVFVALVAVTAIGFSTALAGYGDLALLLGGLVGLAGLIALYRAASAFLTGFHIVTGTGNERRR